jgi:hypothetical protein
MQIVLTRAYMIDGEELGPGEVDLTREQLSAIKEVDKLMVRRRQRAEAAAERAKAKAESASASAKKGA